jgi:hypothetical protein
MDEWFSGLWSFVDFSKHDWGSAVTFLGIVDGFTALSPLCQAHSRHLPPSPSPSLHLLRQRRCTVPSPEDNRLLPVEGEGSATPLPIHAQYSTYRAKLIESQMATLRCLTHIHTHALSLSLDCAVPAASHAALSRKHSQGPRTTEY